MKAVAIILVSVMLTMLLTGCVSMTNRGEQNNVVREDLQINANAKRDAEMEAYVDEAFELLKSNGKDAAEVWPGYELPRNAIIVCLRDDATNKVIRAWKLTTMEKTELTNEQLAGVEIPAAGTYGKLKFEGRKSIIIAINKATIPGLEKVAIANFIYEVGTHEMVHLHYESPFKLIKLANEQQKHGGRGTTFPKVAEPRVYRKMLYDNLVAAFENPDEENIYLGKAKYWFEKWKAEYPGEYYQIKVTDVLEGKARYIQYMLCMPQDLSDTEQAVWIAEHFDRSQEPSASMDSESYKLGFVSGVLLDRRETDWKKQVTKKNVPITEYLLGSVELVEDDNAQYEKLLQTSKAQMAEINAELDGKLENIKQAEKDIRIPFLQMDQKTMAGSFETSDFLNYMGKKLTVEFAGTFENKKGTVKIDHLNVYQVDNMYALPITMKYTLSDGRLIIEDGGVSCDILVEQSTDKDGRTVFTMK